MTAPVPVQQMVPPLRRQKRRSLPRPGQRREAAAAQVDEMLSPAEEPDAEEDAAEGEEQDGAADKSSADPEAHRKAFGELMRGEYNREFGEMIVQATQKAYDSILNEQGPVGRILNALGQKYGTAPGDYEALAAAVEGGVVKDDAYYEDMAMKKGISVQLAKEMDALESENAKHRAAEQQRAEAAKMEAIQQEWDAAAERIRAEDPGFDIKTGAGRPGFCPDAQAGREDGGRLQGPLFRRHHGPAHHPDGKDRREGRGSPDPPAGRTAQRERHQPRRCGGAEDRRLQADAPAVRRAGAPGHAGTDHHFLTERRC